MKKIILISAIAFSTLCQGAAINETNIELVRWLFTAVEANNADMVKQYLKLNCLIPSLDINTLYSFTSFEFHLDGRPPQYRGSHTALHHAIIKDNDEMVKLLLEEKADPNVLAKIEHPNNLESSALDFALAPKEIFSRMEEMYENAAGVVKYFIGHNSILSSELKKERMIRLLLEYGAKVSDATFTELEKYISRSETLVHHPAYYYTNAKRIAFKKSNPKSLANDLHMAVILNDSKAVNCYLAHSDPSVKDNVNDKDQLGFTPLMWAFARGNSDLAKIILDHCDNNNVNLEFANTDDENALALAKKHKHYEIIKLFRNFMINCMSKCVSEKLPRPLLNLIYEYSDF